MNGSKREVIQDRTVQTLMDELDPRLRRLYLARLMGVSTCLHACVVSSVSPLSVAKGNEDKQSTLGSYSLLTRAPLPQSQAVGATGCSSGVISWRAVSEFVYFRLLGALSLGDYPALKEGVTPYQRRNA